MRNNRITEAYNACNPGSAEVERMRKRLLDAIPEEPALRKTYTAQPEKTNRWSVLLAAAACLAVLCFGGFVLMRLPSGVPLQDAETVAPSQPSQIPVSFDALRVYDPILKTYEEALQEVWDEQRCEKEGICPLIVSFAPMPEKIGYALRDLDGDGREELLITDGYHIYDLYIYREEALIRLLSASDRAMMQLCEDNTIFSQGRDGSGNPCYLSLRITEEGVEYTEQIVQDLSRDPGDAWTATDSRTGASVPVTEAEARRRIDGHIQTVIAFTPIVQQTQLTQMESPFGPGDYDDYVAWLYDMEKYPDGLFRTDTLYYTFRDLNQDGIEELLIGNRDGTVSEAITCLDGNLQLLFSVGCDFRVCGNGALVTGAEGDTHYVIYRLSGLDHQVTATVWLDEEQQQWYFYTSGNNRKTEVTKSEAMEIVNSYEPEQLDMLPLSDYPMEK